MMGGVSLFRVKTGCIFKLEAISYTCLYTAGSPYSRSASLNVVEISSSNKPITTVKPVYKSPGNHQATKGNSCVLHEINENHLWKTG